MRIFYYLEFLNQNPVNLIGETNIELIINKI
jgi:hypothetical protein